MKRFFRENPTIAFGLGLPILLVIVFLLFTGIPTLLVDPPKYDVLYATQYYNYQYGVQISVIDKKVKVVYQGNIQNNQKPRIWRYSPQTGAVREISYLLPSGLSPAGTNTNNTDQKSITTVIDVPDLVDLTIDTSSIAPDGYEFNVGDYYSRNVFGGLFHSSSYRHEAVLTKNGRSVRLPTSDGQYYYSRNTHFIGWVVSP